MKNMIKSRSSVLENQPLVSPMSNVLYLTISLYRTRKISPSFSEVVFNICHQSV